MVASRSFLLVIVLFTALPPIPAWSDDEPGAEIGERNDNTARIHPPTPPRKSAQAEKGNEVQKIQEMVVTGKTQRPNVTIINKGIIPESGTIPVERDLVTEIEKSVEQPEF